MKPKTGDQESLTQEETRFNTMNDIALKIQNVIKRYSLKNKSLNS